MARVLKPLSEPSPLAGVRHQSNRCSTCPARVRRRSVVVQRTERRPNAVNLVPRSHTPQVAFPGFAERGSAPSVETANANGRPRVGCKRNAADLPRISCCKGVGHRQSIHYLSHIARKRRAEARSRVSTSGFRLWSAKSSPSNRAQAPSRAGTSCWTGASTARSRVGQPTLPQ